MLWSQWLVVFIYLDMLFYPKICAIFLSTTAVPIKIVYSELVLGIIENELYMLFILFEFFFLKDC